MVTTPVGGIPDLVTHRETGLLLPVDNATELAGALVMVLTDSDLASHLQERAFAKIASDFSPERIDRQLSDLYLEIWNRKLSGPEHIATQGAGTLAPR